jgi:uncharacterized protein (DUF2141 family)
VTNPHAIKAPRPRGGRLAAIGTIIAAMALLLVSLVAVPANAVETGGISGTITLNGDVSVDDAEVYVWAEDQDFNDYYGDVVSSAGTSTTYSFTGLADGQYTVYFRNSSGEYERTSEEVSVAGGAVTNQNVTLQVVPVSITGTITLAGSVPFDDTNLSVYAENDDDEAGGSITRTSDSTATYSVKGLEDGTYSVRFRDYSGEYAKVTLSDVVVAAGGPTTRNVTLNVAATMSGSIRPTGGGALNQDSDLSVWLQAGSEKSWGSVHYDTNTYDITGVPGGSYTLYVTDSEGIYQNQTITGISLTSGATLTRNITVLRVGEIPPPPPPVVVPTAQAVAGGVTKKVKAKKNKKISIPSRTNAGVTLKWKSTTSKVCKIKGKKVQLTGKRGTCKLVAKAGATPAFLALTKKYNIKVK